MKKKKNRVNHLETKIKIEELIIEFREVDKLILVSDLNIIKIFNTIYLKDRDFILKIRLFNKKIETEEIEEIQSKQMLMSKD